MVSTPNIKEVKPETPGGNTWVILAVGKDTGDPSTIIPEIIDVYSVAVGGRATVLRGSSVTLPMISASAMVVVKAVAPAASMVVRIFKRRWGIPITMMFETIEVYPRL